MSGVCVVPRCGALPVARGRCLAHRLPSRSGKHELSATARGYGSPWRRLRAAVLGDACERCGAMDRLQVDHIVPRSLGGPDHPSNLRTLCASCHARVGVRRIPRSNHG